MLWGGTGEDFDFYIFWKPYMWAIQKYSFSDWSPKFGSIFFHQAVGTKGMIIVVLGLILYENYCRIKRTPYNESDVETY